MSYYELDKVGKKEIRKRICERAYREIPNDNSKKMVNIGYGIGSGIIDLVSGREDVILQVESGSVGVDGFLSKGDPEEDAHIVDPGGSLLKLRKDGANFKSVSDSFALMHSGKIDYTFMGAFQVSSNGDLANYAASSTFIAGMGGAMSLAKSTKNVIICMIENDPDGKSKLVDKITLPPTGFKCVDLIITEKGVYKPLGDCFYMTERWNDCDNEYLSLLI